MSDVPRRADEFDGLAWVSARDVDDAARRWKSECAAHPEAGSGRRGLRIAVAHVKGVATAVAVLVASAAGAASLAPVLSGFAAVVAFGLVIVGLPLTLRWHRALCIAAYNDAQRAVAERPRLGGTGGASTPVALPTTTTAK